ncbi:hypothetical protein C1646_758650 [Rhizophagus diaphanus]|nr:hypothetical protein C1646_758650 [Rhizophagus diaphanus] [Rhizophagus sp. MUCL 43196]
MDVDWDFFINFPEDTILPTNFFIEKENVLENIITSPKSPEHFLFNELEEEPTELFDGLNDSLNCSSYQYNLCVEDSFS